MKAPLSWIKEYVDINCSVTELEEKLFSCGFEVEDVIHVGKNIDKIVTCKIEKIESIQMRINSRLLKLMPVNMENFKLLPPQPTFLRAQSFPLL